MIQITQNVIEDIINRIVQEVSPQKIILFGSRAQGKAAYSSDLDLLIIEKGPFTKQKSRWKETNRIRRALSSIHHPKDILVFSEIEVEKWKHSLNHIIYKSINEGKVIYER